MKSDSIKELATALGKAQAEIRGAEKNSVNPHFRSEYANLKAVWDAIRKPLSTHGLSVSQTTSVFEGQLVLVTTLMHLSGEWIEGVYPINPEKTNPQSYGAAMSYARRYCLAGIVGCYEDDDDAESAMERSQPQPVRPTPLPLPNPPDRLGSLRRKLFAVAKEHGYPDEQLKKLVQEHYPHIKSRTELNENQMNFLILWMKQNPKPTEADDGDDDEVFPFEKPKT